MQPALQAHTCSGVHGHYCVEEQVALERAQGQTGVWEALQVLGTGSAKAQRQSSCELSSSPSQGTCLCKGSRR